MKKFGTLVLIIIIASILGGIYGIIHDQLTYTISPEYYTKFKFYQFGLMDIGNEAHFPIPRVEVMAVGVMATWWMGTLIGLVLGLVGLANRDAVTMFRITIKAFAITIAVAFLTGLVGLAYGKYYLANLPKESFNWYFPENLIDFKSFVAVGSMHNFSYLGGLLGLIAGVGFSLWQRKLIKQSVTDNLLATQL